MIPILYEKNEKVFNTLGLGALSDIIKPIVREERNGLFEMEFKYPINSPLFIDLTYGRIVVADASPKLKNQRFVIVRIEADDEGIAHFYCEHIAQFKAKNTTLKPIVNAIDVNAWQALDNWNKSLLGDVTFNVTSDITTISTIKWNISKVKNARLALGGVEGSILDKYHGEYRFDNMNINLMKSRGQNLGAYIAYGKNLTSLSQDLEIENTYTSIQPFVVYMDNIEKVDSSGKVTFERIEKTLVLTEHVLHSEYVNNYPQALVAAVEFDAKDIMAPEVEYTYKDANGKEVRKTDAQVQEERLKRLQDSENTLRIKAQEYIKRNKIGIPKVKINLTFVDLASSLEYKGIAKTEEVNLCDYVTIDFLNLGINRVTSQVVKVEYNPKLERYEKLTIGEIGSKFQSSVVANKKAIEEVKNQLGTVKEDLNIVRVSADGMTLTFYGPDEPIANNVNDKWYKDLGGGDTELRIWDGTIWKFIMSTRDISEAKKAAEDALVKVGEAQDAADAASDKVDAEVVKVNQNIVDLTKDLSDSIAEVDTASKNNYNELTGKVTNLTTALADKPDKTYVDQTIDEKTGTITQTIGQIETKVNELDAVPVYTIGADGYWYKDGIKTSTLAVGKDGKSGVDGSSFTWNMLKGSKPIDLSSGMFGGWSDNIVTDNTDFVNINIKTHPNIGLVTPSFSIIQGKTYTASIDVRTYSGITVFNYLYVMSKKLGNQPLTQKTFPFVTNEWNRFEYTFIAPFTTDDARFLFGRGAAGDGGIDFRNPKVEENEIINTEWTPHQDDLQGKDGKDAMFIGATPPTDTSIAWLDTNTNSVKRFYNGAWYDINSEIKTKLNTVVDTVDTHTRTIGQINADLKNRMEISTFSTFKQEYDQIVSTVQKTETDLSGFKTSTTTKLNEQKQTLDANISKISNLEKDLTSGTTYQKIQTIEQTVDGNKTTIAAVKKTADGAVQLTNFNTTINTVKESISTIGKNVEGIQIGERNLLVNGNNGGLGWTNKNYPVAPRVMLSESGKTLKNNEEVTVVAKFSTKRTDARSIGVYNSGESIVLLQEPFTNITDNILYKTIKWRFVENQSYVNVYIMPSNGGKGEESTVEWIKIVRGNKTSKDWSPAPEDMASLTVFNEFKRTAEQTLSVISDPTKKGLISAINQQAGQILMQVGDATTKSRLNLTKDGTYIDNALIESAHIKDAAITTAKIGDAQIDTAKIKDAAITSAKILNLDVNKVSGLTSEFIQSKWNAINSSVTIDGNGMYIDGDWGGAINFTRRGQTFYDKIKGQVMGYQYGLYRNLDDPLVNSQMLGIYLASEMGYDLRLGIRKQIDNQNNVYMAIKSAGGTATRADIFGATTFFNGINLNGTAITNASNAGYTSTSNPNGICIEFSNGFKIQLKRKPYTTRSTGVEGWTYPKPFSAIPYTFGNAARDDATAANANIAFSNVNESACNIIISDKTNSYSLLVCAIGF